MRKTEVLDTIVSQDPNALHIAVLIGGMSCEREVSLMSSKGIINAIVELGYTVTPIDKGSDLAVVLDRLKPDLVFNGLYGTYGEDGCVPGLLKIMGLKYTHSGVLASAIGFDKEISQEIFRVKGIKCPQRRIIHKDENHNTDPMKRPYVIKPIDQGSSIGVMVIFEEDDFSFANYSFDYGDRVIIEEYIPGQEIQVAVLNKKAIGTLEIECLQRRFYDYDTKYTDGLANHICPARLTKEQELEALEIATKVHNIIGCKGTSRVEFRFDGKDFYLLEINTHPGMTPLSIVPEIAQKAANISFKELINMLIHEALHE